jgi:hypothetical protein
MGRDAENHQDHRGRYSKGKYSKGLTHGILPMCRDQF